jgi:hypothetical protein
MKNLLIYDNGGKSYDRITVIFKDRPERRLGTFEAIGASETGTGFYQYTTAMPGRHLGKRVKFKDLSPELQNKLLNEIKEKTENINLFEQYDQIPPILQKVLNKHKDAFKTGGFSKLKKALREVEKIGYTFEYGLDGIAYELKPIIKQ